MSHWKDKNEKMKDSIDEIERSKVVVINGVRFKIKSQRRKSLTIEAFELKENQVGQEIA